DRRQLCAKGIGQLRGARSACSAAAIIWTPRHHTLYRRSSMPAPIGKIGIIEKLASIGAVIAAAACPACFPVLAVVGSVLGLGVLHRFEGSVFLVFQILVLLALAGNVASFLRHHRILPLIVGVVSPLIIFFALYVQFHPLIL